MLEIIFSKVEENKTAVHLNVFNLAFLYIAYADDKTFFLNDKNLVTKVIKLFDNFSLFSGFIPNKSKRGIGALKGVSKALGGMKYIDRTTEAIKTLLWIV